MPQLIRVHSFDIDHHVLFNLDDQRCTQYPNVLHLHIVHDGAVHGPDPWPEADLTKREIPTRARPLIAAVLVEWRANDGLEI